MPTSGFAGTCRSVLLPQRHRPSLVGRRAAADTACRVLTSGAYKVCYLCEGTAAAPLPARVQIPPASKRLLTALAPCMCPLFLRPGECCTTNRAIIWALAGMCPFVGA
jgi:hypothetical protein